MPEKGNLLIAEWNDTWRTMLAGYAQRAYGQIWVAKTINEALEILNNKRPNQLLTPLYWEFLLTSTVWNNRGVYKIMNTALNKIHIDPGKVGIYHAEFSEGGLLTEIKATYPKVRYFDIGEGTEELEKFLRE